MSVLIQRSKINVFFETNIEGIKKQNNKRTYEQARELRFENKKSSKIEFLFLSQSSVVKITAYDSFQTVDLFI